MSRPDGRIEKGQRLKTAISARAWNRAQDAADIVLGATPGIAIGDSQAIEKASNVLLVRNDSNVAIPPHGVLGITSVTVINPAGGNVTGSQPADAQAREFARRPLVAGDAPFRAVHGEKVAIALEAIAPGAIGRAAIGGVFACRVRVYDLNHQFAIIEDGDVTRLATAPCGPVQLLWREFAAQADNQTRWALGAM